MLRAFLLYLSKAAWAQRIVRTWRLAQRAASRFIAGETFEEALEVIRDLNQSGLFTTLDHLGENVTNAAEAASARDEYIRIIQRLDQADVKSNISIKLTQLGLEVDFDLCLENVRSIAQHAGPMGMLVRIDMEDSGTVDRTLEIFQRLRDSGLENVGLVFQSYLYRTTEDMQAVLQLGACVRLCKGAYNEPPDVAFPRKADVDHNFDRLSEMLIDFTRRGTKIASAEGKMPPITAIATHDEKRIQWAISCAEKSQLPKRALEFQMLYGIRSDLQSHLARQDYPVRVYVPFGTEWYPYFMRRLAERPANLWFLVTNLIRRKGRLA